MKLTDKRFWKFEAMMLLCGVILLCQMLVVLLCNGAEFESCNGAVLILLFPALCSVSIFLLLASQHGCYIKETLC